MSNFTHGYARTGLAALMTLFATACNVGPDLDVANLDLEPATLDDAAETLTRIDEMLAADPTNAEALRALEQIHGRLDALNGLVAQVEPISGHTVSFYESQPGLLGVSESAPEGETLVLDGIDQTSYSVTELFSLLAHGEAPPAALVEAEARERIASASSREASGIVAPELTTSTSSPLPDTEELGRSARGLTAQDGPFFRNNYCYADYQYLDARGCYVNWANGGWAMANAKTSFFTVAPYSGSVYVRFQFQGSTRLVTPVFAGEVRRYWWHSDSWNFLGGGDYHPRHHRWDIIHASGDAFHWAYGFCWTPGFWGCNIAYQ